MNITLNEKGQVFDESGKEIFELTTAQQDYLVKLLYPELPSTAEFTRHQTSYSGVHGLDLDRFTNLASPFVDSDDCEMPDRMEIWGANCGGRDGARRLRTLYCNKFHLYASANDLGLTYDALVKWFQRWRKKALELGLTPDMLFTRPEDKYKQHL